MEDRRTKMGLNKTEPERFKKKRSMKDKQQKGEIHQTLGDDVTVIHTKMPMVE